MRNLIKPAFFLSLILFNPDLIAARQVHIYGTVKDTAGTAVRGAVVSLHQMRLSDTTDESGYYEFSSGVSNTRSVSSSLNAPFVTLIGSKLKFTSDQPGNLYLHLFDISGRTILKKNLALEKPGTCSFDISPAISSGKLSILSIRTSIGSSKTLTVVGGKNSPRMKTGLLFSKKADAQDTLTVRANGFNYHMSGLSSLVSEENVVLNQCNTHIWASWPMPDPPGSQLPNPASYTDLGDGTVRDNVTGLQWQKTITSQTFTFEAAIEYCANLSLAGGGWRLPKRIEMMSIVDFTRTSPAIDKNIFSTPSNFFFTSSPWILTVTDPSRPRYAWVFNFYEGLTSNAGAMETPRCVRCVRGYGDSILPSGQLPNQYTEIAPGEIRDNYTGLVWQQGNSPAQLGFDEAVSYCSSLNLNGRSWRLPGIKEISTLVDETKVYGALNMDMFPGTFRNQWYWSSSRWAGLPDRSSSGAWAINFDDGFTGYNNFTTGWARCVRCENE